MLSPPKRPPPKSRVKVAKFKIDFGGFGDFEVFWGFFELFCLL
jgi:hypothetical protein